MANYEAQIKPSGLSQKNLVDLLCMIISVIKTLCAKLDDDTGVTGTDFEALVYTAIFNGSITDSRGNNFTNLVTAKEDRFGYILPTGISDKLLNNLLYDLFDMVETLCEKLDADGIAGTDYEALVYTALYNWTVTNQKGDTLGNGTVYNFNPGGSTDQKELVNLLAAIVNSIDVLTKKLDADGTVTDTTYHALCDTAIILMQVQNSVGNVYGNALTKFNP